MVNIAIKNCYILVICIREGNGTPLQYSCLESLMDGGAWCIAVHGVAKSWTRLSEFTFTFHSHALEKEMATHFSVLAWRIPGTMEPGGLPSMGSHRVGHDWSDLAAAAAAAAAAAEFLLFRGISTEILSFGEAPEQTSLWGENRVRSTVSVRQPIMSLGVLLSVFPTLPPESFLPCLSFS